MMDHERKRAYAHGKRLAKLEAELAALRKEVATLHTLLAHVAAAVIAIDTADEDE